MVNYSSKKQGYMYLLSGLAVGVLSSIGSFLPEDNGGINMWLGAFAMLLIPLAIALIGLGAYSLLRSPSDKKPQ
jgi:hypothetical protein